MRWQEFRSHIGHLSALQLSRVEEAFALGARVHGDQMRKSGEPYFNHPVAVALMLTEMGADPDTIVAALLHDTVEDTPLTLLEIRELFGPPVETLIEGVTKLSREDVGEAPNLDEQIETLRKIFTLMQRDIRIMVIKLADRLHNMQTVGFLAEPRQLSLARETLEAYVKIADRLCMQDLRDELEALCLDVLEPEIFTKLSALRAENDTRSRGVIAEMHRRLGTHFPELGPSVEARFEHKSWDNLREQLQAEGTAVTGVSSMIAAFVCDDVDACYRVMGALHQMWKRETMSFQDFINTPTVNGYRGLHTTVILEDGTRVRCKIRTRLMHDYARNGVTTLCFRSDSSELHAWLPWTERISSLTEDTQGRSLEFFGSLQSDILGESIMIHGPGDQTVLVPKDSTALDGALHLFRHEALHLVSITVNGQEVPFGTPLSPAVSLNASMGEGETVRREWLDSARTGYATALIRQSLVRGKSEEDKVPIGRELLQRTLVRNRRGFLEEFNEKTLAEPLRVLGFPSLRDVYVAIADGHLDPATAYRELFGSARRRTGDAAARWVARFHLPGGLPALRELMRLGTKYAVEIRTVAVAHPRGSESVRVRMAVELPPNGQEELLKELRVLGARNVRAGRSLMREAPLALLILLWGMDPVFARALLTSSVSLFDLTLIRFVTFFLAATGIYAWQARKSPRMLKPLSPWQPLLFLSGVSLFVTALFTYAALQQLRASQYILFIIAGITVSAFAQRVGERKPATLIGLALACIALSIGLTVVIDGPSAIGLLAGVGSGAGFSLYSLLSGSYQQNVGKVLERYPAYLFWVSAFCLALALPLIPFTRLPSLSPQMLLMTVLFVLVFAVLPYIIFFELMRRMENRMFTFTLPFVAVSAIAGEAVLTGSSLPFAVAPLLALFFAAYTCSTVFRRRQEEA